MPPPKIGCQILAEYEINKAKLIKLWQDLAGKTNSAISIWTKIKYGLISITDVLGAELLSIVGAAASQMVQSFGSILSNAASALLELIFSAILKILLAAPTAVFSLVAIPHEAAIDATNSERRYLLRAQQNINTIMRIILKWLQWKSGDDYLNQIIRALPHITEAIRLAGKVLEGLQPRTPDSARTASFNEGAYKQMTRSLKLAIKFTKPDSFVLKKLQIEKSFEEQKEIEYNKIMVDVNKEYKEKKDDAATRYFTEITKLTSGENNLSDAAQHGLQRHAYGEELRVIDAWYAERKEWARAQAFSRATESDDVFSRAADILGDIPERFSLDMEIVDKELRDLVENTKNAFFKYNESQLYCNNCYNIRGFIRGILRYLIEVLRRTGNNASDFIVPVLEGSQSLMEIVEDDFNEQVQQAKEGTATASVMSASIVKGNIVLIAADAMMSATITDSLVDMINADDVLLDADGEFKKFTDRLASIPDWDGELGRWSVDQANSAFPPYIQLVADATAMLATLPIVAATGGGNVKINKIVNRVNGTFKRLIRHNTLVRNALYSYKPYFTSEAGDLKKLLEQAGLLKEFATSMSLGVLVANLSTDLIMADWEPINIENCKKAYRDLFDDPEYIRAMAFNEANRVEPTLYDKGYQAKAEEMELEIIMSRKKMEQLELGIKSDDLKGAGDIPDTGFVG